MKCFIPLAQFKRSGNKTALPSFLWCALSLMFILPAETNAREGYAGFSFGLPGGINMSKEFSHGRFLSSWLHVSPLMLASLGLLAEEDEEDECTWCTSESDEDDLSVFMMQYNLDVPLLNNKIFYLAPSLAIGGTFFEDNQASFSLLYLGAAVHLRLEKLYVEVGAAFGTSSYSHETIEYWNGVIPLLQVGYLGRF